MNSRRFLSLFIILVILLITVVSAEEKETRRTNHTHTQHKTLSKSTSTSKSKSTSLSSSSTKNIKSLEEDEEDDEEVVEKEEEDKEEQGKEEKDPEVEEKQPEVKTTTTTSTSTTTTKTTTRTTSTTTTKTTTTKTTTTTKSNVPTNPVVSSSAINVNDAPISNAVAPAEDSNPINNPIAPNSNADVNSFVTPNTSSNINTDNNVQKQEGSNSNNVVKISLISIVAVGAVVGVATIGVHAYNKKSGETRDINFGDIEAQPIIHDFGKSNNEFSNTPVEEYNAYNVMNENNRLYLNNNPYEYKLNYDNFVTTPFEKVETDQNNVMNRESIFSNENNTQQVVNDVYNFNNENQQLPYVQGLPVENGFIEKPVANEIEVENFDMRNSQMPTLVPVEPEIIITKPDEEQVNAQDGYKNIVPTVGKMEIIETPDFNKMTTSMIEEHINNMDLENLASINSEPQIQSQQEQEAGYKEIVPNIQEAVIENFDIEDDQEQEFSAVDNITDTYRAALRATYCSTTDDNRFSLRTVDSDHSLLHTMREETNW